MWHLSVVVFAGRLVVLLLLVRVNVLVRVEVLSVHCVRLLHQVCEMRKSGRRRRLGLRSGHEGVVDDARVVAVAADVANVRDSAGVVMMVMVLLILRVILSRSLFAFLGGSHW